MWKNDSKHEGLKLQYTKIKFLEYLTRAADQSSISTFINIKI